MKPDCPPWEFVDADKDGEASITEVEAFIKQSGLPDNPGVIECIKAMRPFPDSLLIKLRIFMEFLCPPGGMSQGPHNIAGCQEVLFFCFSTCVWVNHTYIIVYINLISSKARSCPYQLFEHHADLFG